MATLTILGLIFLGFTLEKAVRELIWLGRTLGKVLVPYRIK